MEAFTVALQEYANVANITIRQVGTVRRRPLRERISNAYMQSELRQLRGLSPTIRPARRRDGRLQFDGESYWNVVRAGARGFGFQVFLHELGHSLGLAHPHDTDMGTLLLPG